MDPGTVLVALFGTLAAFGAPIALLYMWTHRPAARKDLSASPASAALEARLERIEIAVQAIAIETERIAEGQRFTTKLLTGSPGRQAAITDRVGA